MAGREHRYETQLRWIGNLGTGTATYAGYSRDHLIEAGSKPLIAGSADPAFRGDPARWNPEDLLVAALSSCHQLAYLALCAKAGIAITSYEDAAEGVMEEDGNGGRFISAVLRPRVLLAPGSDRDAAEQLHHVAHERCFIASSVNFPVSCIADVRVESEKVPT